MSKEIWRWSATETAAAIREGGITCVEAVESALARMGEANAAVNAVIVDLSETALERARQADTTANATANPATGPLGSLRGVPITIKDNVDQAGLPNPNGVPAYRQNVADEDSPVVTNLTRAGAIVIGRTNTPEFSLRWFTDNPLWGMTHNPWDKSVTPGGSTGGGAAAVALGIGAIAQGSDLGGSLRYPGYACGVPALRPSLGRIPAHTPSAEAERPLTFQLMSVQGPVAREVRDLRLALAAMAGGSPLDPWWVPAPLEGPQPAGPIRVAVTGEPAGVACHPAVRAAIDDAAGYLADAGYAVEAKDPPQVAEIADLWRAFIAADTKYSLGPAIREHGSEDINRVYGEYTRHARALDLEGYIQAVAERTAVIRAWNLFGEDYPLVLAPVSQAPPYPQNEDLKGSQRLRDMLDEQSMLYAVNVLGLPAVAVPTGLDGGVPMGVQLIGPRFREDLCLDAAQVIEDRVGVLAHRLWDME